MTLIAEHRVRHTSPDGVASVAVAVDLDPIFPTVASCRINGDQSERAVHPIPNRIPPSVLVPRLAGEPLRLDVTCPAHPRGAGFDWPPESVVPPDGHGGRIPLLHAWDRFAEGAESLWEWSPAEGQKHQVRVVDALAAAFKELAEYGVQPRALPEAPVLVVPNRLTSADQQALIDGIRAQGSNVRLLWRPVAAVSYWCEKHPGGLGTGGGRHHVLAVHMGLDEWEITVLEVVRNEKGVLIPARSRPNPKAHRDCMYGRYVLDQMLLTLLRPETHAARWHSCWCSPAMPNALRVLGQLGSKSAQPVLGRTFDDLLRRLAGREWETEAWLWSECGSWPGSRLQSWRQRLQAVVAEKNVIGAVVTGPLAGLLGVDGTPLGLSEIRRASASRDAVVVESQGDCVLTRGAVRCAEMMARGDVAYMDTLPRLRTLIRRQGEPVWADLLEAEERYVQGGRTWSKHRDYGFAIPAHAHSLQLAIDHEEDQTVGTLTVADLPEAPRNQPVQLVVSIEPAQGNARVELLPENVEYLGRRRVVFDSKRNRKETGQTPSEYIEALPRHFPRTGCRKSDRGKWEAMRPLVVGVATSPALNCGAIQQLHRAFAQKVATGTPEDVTAVSSDGTVTHAQPDLARLEERLAAHLLRPRISSEMRQEITRTLAYASTENVAFQSYLAKQLARLSPTDNSDEAEAIVVAAGQCAREPQLAAALLRHFVSCWIRNRGLTLEYLKAAARVLGYREHATSEFESDSAYRLLDAAASVFGQQLRAGNARHLFIASAKVIVFLLRRRAYDETFLDPHDDRATRIKTMFRKAIDDLRNGDLDTFERGSVDLPDLLEQMIKYIDKCGGGTILVEV